MVLQAGKALFPDLPEKEEEEQEEKDEEEDEETPKGARNATRKMVPPGGGKENYVTGMLSPIVGGVSAGGLSPFLSPLLAELDLRRRMAVPFGSYDPGEKIINRLLELTPVVVEVEEDEDDRDQAHFVGVNLRKPRGDLGGVV